MIDDAWAKDIDSISGILKDAFGENFENASIHQKLFLLEAAIRSIRLDTEWDGGNIADDEIADLEFPEFFEDTQEAMKLIQELTLAISKDMTFHNLAIGGLC